MMMDKAPIVAAIISSGITFLGLSIAYIQWRRDYQIKLKKIHDEVSVEMIRQCMNSYSQLFKKLEPFSQIHKDTIIEKPDKIRECYSILQDAMYNEVGLLSSHQTRIIIGFARVCCIK